MVNYGIQEGLTNIANDESFLIFGSWNFENLETAACKFLSSKIRIHCTWKPKKNLFHILKNQLNILLENLTFFVYWYQGWDLTHLYLTPASVRILIEAASAARTVSLTDCIKFCAFPTSISVASWSSAVPVMQQSINKQFKLSRIIIILSNSFSCNF